MTYQSETFKSDETPRWIMSKHDLPPVRTPGKYQITKADGTSFIATLKGRKRQVVDAMLIGPLFCASTVRLGDAVFRLKEDNDLHAATRATKEGRKYYTLAGQDVRLIDGGAA